MTENEVRTIIKMLDKQHWTFNGYDHCNYEFVFMREDKTWIDYVSIGYGILGTSRKRKTNKPPFLEFESFHFNQFELPLFYQLYQYVFETRHGLPLDMAKNQKTFDNLWKWECGETYCTFENGVLSCGVVDDE